MANEISKTQIDRLGDRLRKGDLSEADLRLLDQYRRSFSDAYEAVAGKIRKELALEPTGRPAKSTPSIIEKLRREHIRLSQIQDIAGCRVTVLNIAEQDNVVRALADLFERRTVIDRRQQPSHGYRAVHMVVSQDEKMLEIQVRTVLQHLWAELSEKLSDVVDPAIKYGNGSEEVRTMLTLASTTIAKEELREIENLQFERELAQRTDEQKRASRWRFLGRGAQQLVGMKQALADSHERLRSVRQEIAQSLQQTTELVETLKGKKNALLD